MNLTIYTFGQIDSMYDVMNGIAMFFDSTLGTTLISLSAAFAGFMGCIIHANKAATNSASIKGPIKFGLSLALILNMLIYPKTTIRIKDLATQEFHLVDNIPVGLALPVGILEGAGIALATVFEQAFSSSDKPHQVNDYLYLEHGMVFGARILDESRHWRTDSPTILSNVKTYHRRCIIGDKNRHKAGKTNKYSIEQLKSSPNMIGLLKSKASRLRHLPIIFEDGIQKNVTCREGIEEIERSLESESHKIAKKYQGTLLGRIMERGIAVVEGAFGGIFNNRVNNVFRTYGISSGESRAGILKQQLMINALRAVPADYAATRAEQHLIRNWMLSGEMAQKFLPIMLSILKGLIYTSFIFMIPIFFTSGWVQGYLGYLKVVFSLQLWPALCAVINMFCSRYAAAQITYTAGGALTFINAPEIVELGEFITAVAASLYMMVPILSYSLVAGGVHGFVQVTSSVGGAVPAVTGQIANEVVTGNKSFDNVSVGNQSYANTSAFKNDTNISYKDGMSEYQGADGIIRRQFADRSDTIFDNTLTRSTGNTAINLQDSIHGNLNRGLVEAETASAMYSKIYSEAKSRTMGHISSYLKSIVKGRADGKNYDFSEMGQYGEIIQRTVGTAEVFRDHFNVNTDTATELAIKASVDPSGFIKDVSQIDAFKDILSKTKGLTDKAKSIEFLNALSKLAPDIRIEGLANRRSGNQLGIGKEFSANQGVNHLDTLDHIVKGVSSTSFNERHSIDKNLSNNITNSFDDMKRAEHSKVYLDQSAYTYSHAIQLNRQQGVTVNQDARNLVQQAMVDDGYSPESANQLIEVNSAKIQPYVSQVVQNREYDLYKQASMQPSRLSQDRKNNLKNSLGDVGDDLKDDVKIRAQQVATADDMDVSREVDMSAKHDVDKITKNTISDIEGVKQAQLDAKEKLRDRHQRNKSWYAKWRHGGSKK